MDKMWHRINFKINHGSPTNPEFHLDLMIIDLLIRPVLKKFEQDFEFWSFHKGIDQSGHVLEFRFYSIATTLQQVLETVKSNENYSSIKNQHLMEDVNCEQIGTGGLEVIADENWAQEIKHSWPHFIKGTCEMYLDLITEIKKAVKTQNDRIAYYREIEEKIRQQWHDYAWHAYLHHLAAVFGYYPIGAAFRGVNPHNNHFDLLL